MSFAAFTDTHVSQNIRSPGWDFAGNLDKLGDDIMNNTLPCEFVIHLGDGAYNNTAFVNGVGLPPNLASNPKANLKEYFINHLKLPLHYVGGNIDLTDYGHIQQGVPGHQGDPFILMKTYINETELNTYPYAMMRNGILFLMLPEEDFEPWTRPSTYEWVEFMTTHYHNATTIITAHQAIEDTTPADGANDPYRGQQDQAWWASLFQRNPQIKMYLHGHNHMSGWYQGNQSSGFSHPVQNFGHEMLFTSPFPGMSWITDFNPVDQMFIYTISAKGFTAKAWKNEGNIGKWTGGLDMTWIVPTTYDPAAEDWYSFPLLIQDGETQTTDNKVLAGKVSLQLVGSAPMELFYDPKMETYGIHTNENLLGFDDEGNIATPNMRTLGTPGMTVSQAHTITFPPRHEWDNYCHDGHGGPPYQTFAVGTTPAAAPGGSYTFTMTARSNAGATVTLKANCSDWGTKNQLSVLKDSEKEVFSKKFGAEFETVTGTYVAPNDEMAWFIAGSLQFSAAAEVSFFSIKRTQESDKTEDYKMTVSGKTYDGGSLARFEAKEIPINPVELAGPDGIIKFKAAIKGNHYGMANVVYSGPVLMSRNARYKVNAVNGNNFDISLTAKISGQNNNFEMFPFSTKYGGLQIQANGAQKSVSNNGNQWVTYPIPQNLAQEKIQITFPVPRAANEMPPPIRGPRGGQQSTTAPAARGRGRG